MPITTDSLKLRRQQLDKISGGITKLFKQSREIALARTSLQEGVMFLGLALGDIGNDTPYVSSSNPENKNIEKRADVSPSQFNFENEDHILQVKELRFELEKEIENVKRLYLNAFDTEIPVDRRPFFPTHLINAFSSVEKSRMWLGMELNRILNEQGA